MNKQLTAFILLTLATEEINKRIQSISEQLQTGSWDNKLLPQVLGLLFFFASCL